MRTEKFEIPFDVILERDVLSAVIHNPTLTDMVCYEVNSGDFHYPAHVKIFTAFHTLNNENIEISFDVVVKHFEREDTSVIGALLDIHNQYFSPGMLNFTIKKLKAVSLKRSLFRAAENGLVLFNGKEEITSDRTLAWLDGIRNISSGYQSSKFKIVKEVIQSPHDDDKTFLGIVQERQELYRSGKEVFTGHKTHYADIDRIFGGFNEGHLTLIGARPAVGKTTFMVNLILNQLTINKIPVGIFSLEMPMLQIVEKMIYCSADIDWKQASKGMITSEEYQRIVVKSKELEETVCLIDDKGRSDLNLIISRAHHWKERYGVKIIFVDYIGLIRGVGRFNNKYEEITHISQQMKILAKDLSIPIVCLAQLNRGIEGKSDKAPQASDLRDSGSLEQDSDEIFLLHSPSLYDKYDKPGILQVLLRKNRFGPTGQVDLQMNGATGKINNLAKLEEEKVFSKGWSASADS